MNIQGWFPLELTSLTSLLSKGLFPITTIQKHQFFSSQPSLWSNSHYEEGLLKCHIFISIYLHVAYSYLDYGQMPRQKILYFSDVKTYHWGVKELSVSHKCEVRILFYLFLKCRLPEVIIYWNEIKKIWLKMEEGLMSKICKLIV